MELFTGITRFDFTPVLGWSVSRYDKFLSCKRMYYYDYYGRFDLDRSRIEKLKKMTSVALEKGNIVHDVVGEFLKRLLKSEKPIDKEKFFDFAREKAREYCKAKTFCELHYGECGSVDTGGIAEGAVHSLGNFLESERYSWITRKAVANKNKWLIEPPGYGETRIDGMKAYCKVDFLFPVDNEAYVIDWKTGKRHEAKHRKQLQGYSSWVAYHYGTEAAAIKPLIAYLEPVYSEFATSFDAGEIADFTSVVKKETEEMYGYCSDIKQNIPKEKDTFEKTANGMACKFCNYRELCKTT